MLISVLFLIVASLVSAVPVDVVTVYRVVATSTVFVSPSEVVAKNIATVVNHESSTKSVIKTAKSRVPDTETPTPSTTSTESSTSVTTTSISSTSTYSLTTSTHKKTSTASTASKSSTTPSASTVSSTILSNSSSSLSYSFDDTIDRIWLRFWDESKLAWNGDDSNCDKYTELALWDQAVVGRAIVAAGDTTRIESVIANILNYENTAMGAFSASTAKDTDIYTDDNAQVSWVFTDAYKNTGNQEYLSKAENIVKYLMSQTDDKGGVIWKYQAEYIASISTSEAAVAALRLYDITKDKPLLEYAINCTNYMFDYFQDPSDKLFYDGLEKNDYSNVNKGKLAYTVGCTISSLSYLYMYTLDTQWKEKALELADVATTSGCALYNGDSYWNNQLKYVQLLYSGFADLSLLGLDTSTAMDEVKRQFDFLVTYLQDPDDVNLYVNQNALTSTMVKTYESKFSDTLLNSDSTSTCSNGKTKKSLMDNGSMAQILYNLKVI